MRVRALVFAAVMFVSVLPAVVSVQWMSWPEFVNVTPVPVFTVSVAPVWLAPLIR